MIQGASSSDAVPVRKLSFAHGAVRRGYDALFVVVAVPLVGTVALMLLVLNPFVNPGPVFFRQRRVGRAGTPITIWKFRSYSPRADGPPEVSTLGNLLRKTWLDELPQVFNILTGDMTLVGPRPEQPHLVAHYAEAIPRYQERHAMTPGLTGLAQLRVGYADDVPTTRRKLVHDLDYIENASIGMDLKLIFQTISAVFAFNGSPSDPTANSSLE